MTKVVLDIEADNLLEQVTVIHCLCYYNLGTQQSESIVGYDKIIMFLEQDDLVLIGHNIARYDIPVLEKILSIKLSHKFIDTLAVSWYLYPLRNVHGLEEHGETLGVAKPIIEDWKTLDIKDYVHRCEVDVVINTKLFNNMFEYLMEIYLNEDAVWRILGYLSFKMDCAREQEEVNWKLDIPVATANLEFLLNEIAVKMETLRAVMPPVTVYRIAARPKVFLKKDGTVSSHGEKWLQILKEMGLPDYHVGTVKIPVKQEPANPGSHPQLKEWLFSLGWVPDYYKYEKEKDGSLRKIPQISNDEGTGLSDSVKALIPDNPGLEALDSLFKARHRSGLLKGFLRDVDPDGYLKAEIVGLTNTLRYQHKTIVNLPTIYKAYGDKVRGCLIASEGEVLCGSDMSGLEDNTKRHYMFYYDPDFVKEMSDPSYDAHLDIALLSGLLTSEQVEEHKSGKKKHTGIRLKAKKVNFAGVYGAGPPKIALTANIPLKEAKVLHTTYWKRNWSVKKVAENCYVKVVRGQMWLYNPVSQFYYALRADKDRFSTLNQGTGVYCFDSWVRKVRSKGVKICGQFHDEIIIRWPKGKEEELKAILMWAIDEVNAELELNVTLRISIDFGHAYSDIH